MTDHNKDREAAFDRIVHEYYQAVEHGNPVESDRFIAEHPDFEAELQSFFGDLKNLNDVGGLGELPGTNGLDATGPGDGDRHLIEPGVALTYVGQYRILEELARGGMGVVFKARQEKLRRTVALKMILSGRYASEAEVDRFRREARATAALKHPHIVGVHEIGVHEGNHYFTMDYIESVSLAQQLREGSLAPRDAANLLVTIAQATHYAHEKGVLHRDLKPANVLIDSSGRPHITDFGLAKTIAEAGDVSATEITRSGQVVGTPSYMAPEQAAAKHELVSVASDVYSLGAILYACLSGRAPFVAESTVETLRQVIHDDPLPTRVLNPRVPKDLETICLKCLSKEPRHRYPSAAELADDLQRFLEGRPVSARPVSVLTRTWRIAKRNPWASLATTLMFLIAVVSPVVAIQQYRQKNEIDGLLFDKQQALVRALAAEKEATASTASARAQSLHNGRLLYISDMQRMAELYKDADIRAMHEMLARHIPDPENPDLRDFEWYYWRGKCDSQSVSWAHDSSVDVIEVSSDGKWVASCCSTGNDTAFQVRDARTGRLENTFQLAGLRVSSFKFRNDHEMIVAARGQKELVLVVDWLAGEIASELLSFPANPQMPASRFAFSDSAGLVAHSFMAKVRCYDTSTGQSLRIRLPKDADTAQYRKKNVIYKDKDGRYIDFIGHVSGATQTRLGNSVMQSDPTNGVARYWEAQNEFSPGNEQDGGPVLSLDFSPSEDLLAAGSREGRIKIWKRSSGEELLEFAAHDGIIWDLAFSSDDQRLASAGDDGSVRIWDLSSGALLSELTGHTGAVKSIDFGKSDYLVSGGMDRLTQVWQLPSKYPLATLRGNEGPVTGVCMSPNARFCWSAGADKRVRMWPVAGESPPIVVADPAPFGSADISADQGLVAASGLRSGVSVWDVVSGRRRFLAAPTSASPNPICHTRIQEDEGAVWALTWDGSLLRWDLETGRRELQRKFPVKLLSGMPQAAISPDGSRVAVQQRDGSVTIASTSAADAPSVVLGSRFDLALLKFSADGKHLLTNVPAAALDKHTDEVTLQLWDAESGRLLADVARGSVFHADASKNGRVAFVDYNQADAASEKHDEEIVVWDQSEQREIARHSLSGIKTLAISPDGSILAIVLGEDDADQSTQRRISVRRVDDGLEIYGRAIPCQRLAFTPGGSQLLVTGMQGRIDLLDAGSGQLQKQLVNSVGSITSVAYAPHEASIAATFTNRSSFGRSIISLDSPVTQKSSLVPSAIREPAKIPAVYLPDGRLTYQGLVWQLFDLPPELKSRHKLGERTGCLPEAIAHSANVCFFLAPDRTLFRCDLAHADKVVHTANPLPAKGSCGAMSTTSDGRLIALAFAGEIQIYDGRSLSRLHVIENIQVLQRALALSNDGSLLASGGFDGAVNLWRTHDWAPQRSVLAHSKLITKLRFSPRGQTIVSASEDGKIVLSDVITGSPKTTFDDHEGTVHWIDFSATGDELASAGEDGTIRRWQATDVAE